ncbi:MAG: hypothetical protein J6X17_01120 [Lachnospiraceae bacterium]|nr:hypothetical protein [Lachnospiraceae bacterium]
MDIRQCRRCLLYETADKAAYESVQNYIASIPEAERADESVYRSRLSVCKECDMLISGMCRKCGCYVEVRAFVAGSDCPGGRW